MTTTLARADKLDTPVVNGPYDDDLDWDAIYWRPVEENVRRLRQRIFKASQEGDLKRVRNLQRLMLRSRSNTLVSVRRVTQHNAGRKTAGIDGEVWAARCFPDSVFGPFQAAFGNSRCDARISLGVRYPSPEWSLR